MHIVSGPQSEPVPPARVAPLAVLPVFFSLRGKKAVVAGGTAAAAWKAELLAASGASVEIHARRAELSEEMSGLISHGASGGTLRLIDQPWQQGDFTGAALIVGDIEEEQAEAFVAKARAAGVPVNVIDKPPFCDFQFGSIVNRSPVVVGISTDGAAPILGQAVRRRIETLLPASLGTWGAIARQIRAAVMHRFRPGPPRRAFWERFVDRAFSGAPTGPATILDDLSATGTASGKVTFVGAGPGDAESLTIGAMRALQAADVIVFGPGISADVLELARREARRICADRHGGKDLLRSLAGQGANVVCLKTGNPSDHPRSVDEMDDLSAAGISVETVPGISAGSVSGWRHAPVLRTAAYALHVE